jgi:LemA protein
MQLILKSPFKKISSLLSLLPILPLFLLTGLLSSCGMQSIPTALNDVDAKWAEVHNQYKRRADLIPNLVAVVKGYAKHEKDTLEAVVNARANATKVNFTADQLTPENMKRFSDAQQGLTGALSRLMMVVEKYPDLKANENFRDLQTQLEGTENRTTIARNRYIESVQSFNNLITVPPTSWYNSIFLHHPPKPQFSTDDYNAIKDAPKVSI